MLRVNEDKKEGNECPKEYREAEEGKVVTVEAEGKNIQYESKRRKIPPYDRTERKCYVEPQI